MMLVLKDGVVAQGQRVMVTLIGRWRVGFLEAWHKEHDLVPV